MMTPPDWIQLPDDPQELALITEIIPIFLEDATILIESIQHAIENQDWHQAHTFAHELKGSASFIHATPLVAACQIIETACEQVEITTVQQHWPQLKAIYQATVNALNR